MTNRNSFDLKHIFSQFHVPGDFQQALPYGNGHINDTFVVYCRQAGLKVRYILQRINRGVFRQPLLLMDNVHRICSELHRGLLEAGDKDASRRALTCVLTHEKQPYYCNTDGQVWRLYLFIEGASGIDVIENEDQAFQAAHAFGEFQKLLIHLPGERLHETIPGFHDTPERFRNFCKVVDSDPFNRCETAKKEIDFYLSFKNRVSRLKDLKEKGVLPERVTHNDTKLNNVLIDEITHKAVCVTDLDTAMPGLAAYDFGDLVRTSTSTAAEDEKDLSKVVFQPGMFRALVRGFFSSAADFLTSAEKESLYFGGILMTYETGIRFLTDYLEGNVYYKTAYEEHNLIRTRTQISLIHQMEQQEDSLESFILDEFDNQA